MDNNRTAYSKLSGFRMFSYNCITKMMDENELIWKLLYYNDADAWDKPNLTKAQKRGLIYKGEQDETLFRVFMSEKQMNSWTAEVCLIRIFPNTVYAKNRTVNITSMAFDVYSHYRIDTLSNYTTRTDTIVEELVALFNGSNVGGLGVLFFDASASRGDRVQPSGQVPFGGKRIIMSTNQG